MSTFSDRLSALRRLIAARAEGDQAPIEALLITSADNRTYVSGFTGSAGVLLVTAEAALLLTDFRYVEQATAQATEFEVVKIEGYAWPAVAQQAQRLGVHTLGFEAEHLTVDAFERLTAALKEYAPQTATVSVHGIVEGLRVVKSAPEVEKIRRAVELADRALETVAAGLRPGATERQVAWRLESLMRERGADGLAFPTIVAAGPHGAMAHHQPGDRPIQEGEPIVIDMGCRLDGYNSDITRTLVLGEPDAQFWTIFRTVLRAQQTCEAGLRAGMLGKEGDKLARDVIEAAGHGDHFGHGTGHGVGLQVHEDPYLSRTRGEMVIPEGAVVTVEPGIYLPGWGGVRIEDMLVVGAARSQILTTAHKFPVVSIAD